MKAVVMAGGEGSRLRPLTVGRPKPMVPIVGKPVMEHILNLLKDHGIVDVIVTVQYLARNIEDYFGDGSQFGMNISYSLEDVPLGTAGSVKNAEAMLGSEDFLVISGDALTDFDLTKIIEYHQQKKAMATITLAHVPNPLEYGVIITAKDGHVTQFLEKPSWGEVFSDTINTGVYVLNPKILSYFEKDKQFDFSQDLFPILLKNKDPLYGYVADGYWCDVGNLQEYMRANADVLKGNLKARIHGKNIGNDIWVEEGVDISPDAQLHGPIFLGHDSRVRSGAIIYGPSSFGHYTIIDDRAQVDRSIVWNNSYIGELSELRGAIVGSSTSIKSKAIMFEGAVVGDNSIIQDGAIIQSNVKIWPNKEIEAGAVVNTSIIWGSQGRRSLFGRHGVTGLVNVDITPEFAAKLGASFGAILQKGSWVCVNRDAHRTPRMVKRAIISGLPSAGLNVHDLETVPLPVARFNVRTTNAAGGVHIRLSPFDPRVVDIKFFDQNGLDISKNTERKIENLFSREDFRRVYLDDIGTIEYANEVVEKYTEHFMKVLNVEETKKRGFRIVVDYGHGSSSLVLPQILNSLNCDVITLNASMDEKRYSRTSEEFERDVHILASITGTLHADLGIRLDPGGEKIFAIDGNGRILENMQLLAVMTNLVLRRHEGGTIGVPVTASSSIGEIAEQHKGHILYTKLLPHALMTAANRDGVVLVGDGDGGFIFPDFHPGFDGLMAIAKLLEYLAIYNTSLKDVVDSLPDHYMAQLKVTCPWEQKGKVMRILSEQYRERRQKPIDGIKIDLGQEWVLILPDADRPLFHIFAESSSKEQARALVDKYARVVSGLQQD